MPDLRSIKGGLSDGWTPGRMLLITSIQTPANHDQLLLMLGCTLTNVHTCALAKSYLARLKTGALHTFALHCANVHCKALFGFFAPMESSSHCVSLVLRRSLPIYDILISAILLHKRRYKLLHSCQKKKCISFTNGLLIYFLTKERKQNLPKHLSSLNSIRAEE